MRTRSIRPGDLVLVNHRGRIFYAKVTGQQTQGVLGVEPLEKRVTYRTAKAREIVDHWVRAGRDRSDAPSDDQPRLDGWDDAAIPS